MDSLLASVGWHCDHLKNLCFFGITDYCFAIDENNQFRPVDKVEAPLNGHFEHFESFNMSENFHIKISKN